MGKKSRAKKNKKNKKKLVRVAADEVTRIGPMVIERFGRMVRFSNVAAPEQHAEMLRELPVQHAKVIAKLKTEVPALQALVAKWEPLVLLQLSALEVIKELARIQAGGPRLPENDLIIPTLEYLQYLVARTTFVPQADLNHEESWDQISQKMQQVMGLCMKYLLTRKTGESPPSPTDELQFTLDSRRLYVRLARYPYFDQAHLESSLLPYGQWIKAAYGIEAQFVVDQLMIINRWQQTMPLQRAEELAATQQEMAARLAEKGFAYYPEMTEEEQNRMREVMHSEEFRDLYAELQRRMARAYSPAMFDITDLTALPKEFLSLLSVRPSESILTQLTGPNHDDLSPLSPSLLHFKPFLQVEDKFYHFYHSAFEDRLTDIIETDIFERRPDDVPVMAKRRGDRLEADTLSLLSEIVAPEVHLQSLYYPNPDGSGQTELDGLLRIDDILFLVEAKAGGLSDQARRGAPLSIEGELSDLIIEGQRQSERAERYLRSLRSSRFYDQTGTNEILRLESGKIRRIFRIVVTREELGWVGARIAILSRLDPNLSKSYPWHVSMDDLRAVAILFKADAIHFVHYLERRLDASSQTDLTQHDELDHIALYHAKNYYHQSPVNGLDRITYDASYLEPIERYFSSLVTGESVEFPQQKMPAAMTDFIEALNRCRIPGRIEAGCIALNLDDEGREKIAAGLRFIQEDIPIGRKRQIRLPINEAQNGISISIVNPAAWDSEVKASAVQMQFMNATRWAVVQISSDPLRVQRIEILTPGQFSANELAPYRMQLDEEVHQFIASHGLGRNDRCPCSSGSKVKNCHGRGR